MCRNGLHELTPGNVIPGSIERCVQCRRDRGARTRAKAKRRQILHRDFLPTGPLRAWLWAWKARNPEVTWRELSDRVGVVERVMYSIRSGTCQKNELAVVARILDALGEPGDLHRLYPADGSKPILPAKPKVRKQVVPRTCRSGDNCPRPLGHGPNGRFCTHHGAELDRILAEMRVASDKKMSQLNRGRAAANRLKKAAAN